MAKQTVILMIVLALFWAALSGYFHKPVLLVAGGLSVVCVTFLSLRMKIVDADIVPYIHGKSLGYFSWLFKEITKANMQVVRAVLSPDMEISPTLVRVPMGQDTEMGKTTFANSITLTPGTISMDVEGNEILVHALLKDMAAPAGFDEMGRRAGWAVSDPMQTQARLDAEAKARKEARRTARKARQSAKVKGG